MRTRLGRMTRSRDAYRRVAHSMWDWAEQLAAEVAELRRGDLEAEADRQAAGNSTDQFPYVRAATIRFTTESGATYLLRDDGTHAQVKREQGPMNPRMRLPNDEWLDIVGAYRVERGWSAEFDLANDLTRITTPVVGIDVVT